MYFKCSICIIVFIWNLIMVSCNPLQNYFRCRLDSNISTSEISRLQSLQLPETQEGKCYIACLLKMMGLVNAEGNVDPLRTINLGRLYALDTTRLAHMEITVLDCGDKAKEGEDNDACNISFLFIKCTLERREAAMPTVKVKRNIPAINITLPPLTFVLAMLSLL